MTATPLQLANSSAPSAGAVVPARSSRRPGSPAQLNLLRDRNGARGAREEGSVRSRHGEPSAARTGQRDSATHALLRTDGGLGNSPVSQA